MSDCIIYDLTTCNMIVWARNMFYVFYDFSHFKVFINIHGYSNQILFAYVTIE